MSEPTPAQQAEILEQMATQIATFLDCSTVDALRAGAAALRAAVSPQAQIESAGDVTPEQAVEMLKVMGPVVEKAAIGYSANQFYAIAKAIRLRAAVSGEGKTCVWTLDSDEYRGDSWDSACGETWCFVEGGPDDNRVTFCQGCGGRVIYPAAPQEDSQ